MYSKETKAIIVKLLKNLKREKQKGTPLISLNDPIERAHVYTGISTSALRTWIDMDDTPAKTPAKNKKRGPKEKLDSFDVNTIVNTVQKMFAAREVMTVIKLKKTLEENCDLNISKTTLWRCLKAQGYAFRKTGGNRHILCERGDLRRARAKFLREIKKAREQNTNLVFLDETWVNVNHTFLKEWMKNDLSEARAIPTGKGQRLILLHAVDDKQGFIPDCKLLFKSNSTDGRDYHTEMNGDTFEYWLKDKLLPALDEPSLVLLDNASYHTRKDPATTAPTMASKLDDMREWLKKKGLAFPEKGPGSHKKDLLEIINANKPPQEYIVDNLIREYGHEPLRLPPYHCQFNPIELLWGIIKNDVAANNTEFKLDAMKALTEKAIDNVSLQTIKMAFEHAKKIEEAYWQRDGLHISPEIPPMLINLDNTSDEYTSYAASSSDE